MPIKLHTFATQSCLNIMKQFTIKILLDNGDEIKAKAMAETVNDAVDKILSTEQAIEFVDKHQVDGVKVIDVQNIPEKRTEGFVLQESETPGFWVVTDTKNNLVCKFLERNFNETQKITDLNDNPITDPLALAMALREIGDYLYSIHPELIC